MWRNTGSILWCPLKKGYVLVKRRPKWLNYVHPVGRFEGWPVFRQADLEKMIELTRGRPAKLGEVVQFIKG